MDKEIFTNSEVVERKDSSLAIAKSEEISTAYKQRLINLILTNKKTQELSITDDVIKRALEEWNIDTNELLKEGLKIKELNPSISKFSLKIELLSIVANNKKHQKMSKVAEDILAEEVWKI